MFIKILNKLGLDYNRKTVCKKCHVEYQMGYNGIASGLCDRCAGIKRDKHGLVAEKRYRASRQAK